MRIVYLLLLVLLTSCSGPSAYEQAIADFVQTDKKGTKYDLKFKVLEIKELKKITVGDSITILTDDWEKEKTKKLTSLTESLERSKASLEKEKTKRFSTQTMIDMYNKSIDRYQHTIDSISSFTPEKITQYGSRNKEEVLAILVECKYNAVPPMTNTTIEETREFVLSPDGKKCYRQSAPKKE